MKVLLVHGLNRTPLSMFRLGAALRRDGHRTGYFGYAPALESLPGILNRLVNRLRLLGRSGEPIGLVAHSLGGLLLRLALLRAPVSVHRLIMLGTPNRQSRMAVWFWQWRLFRWLTSDCGRLLASPNAISEIAPPAISYTIIAGTAGPRHLRLAFGEEPNDGIVAVSETRIHDDDRPLLVPAYHSFLMDDRRVQTVVRSAMMSDSNSSE